MIDWKDEFKSPDEIHKALLALRKDYANERSKNAYISVTGKSIKAIQADGIYEMVSALRSPDGTLDTNAIMEYATKLE
ncbi:hypothetical protein LMH73_019140 [Vibrio splendidus]|nr:hypothetical protein [Vibrio splendidus]MCC4883103.1 hypothetical protein [Vibrio splendidus]